jgi:hypothetical protein
VVPGHLHVKTTRQALYGIVSGGAGSMGPEKAQRAQIESGTNVKCEKTFTRINKRTREMIEICHPMTQDDGFDYTENFDGVQRFGNKIVWINLKSVIGKGGSQTRTLRDETYPFIEAQLNYLVKNGRTDYYFVNILDGDEAASVMGKYKYLLSWDEFKDVKNRVYVGDMFGYFDWIKSAVC